MNRRRSILLFSAQETKALTGSCIQIYIAIETLGHLKFTFLSYLFFKMKWDQFKTRRSDPQACSVIIAFKLRNQSVLISLFRRK